MVLLLFLFLNTFPMILRLSLQKQKIKTFLSLINDFILNFYFTSKFQFKAGVHLQSKLFDKSIKRYLEMSFIIFKYNLINDNFNHQKSQ